MLCGRRMGLKRSKGGVKQMRQHPTGHNKRLFRWRQMAAKMLESHLNKLNGDGRFSNTSSSHDNDFVRLCYTASIARLRHDDRQSSWGVQVAGNQKPKKKTFFFKSITMISSAIRGTGRNKNNCLPWLDVVSRERGTREGSWIHSGFSWSVRLLFCQANMAATRSLKIKKEEGKQKRKSASRPCLLWQGRLPSLSLSRRPFFFLTYK